MRNKQLYQTSIVDQKQNRTTSYRNDSNNHRGGYRGQRRYNNNGPKMKTICFICYKPNHLCTECPYKDQTDLKFCTKCGVGDHSLEDSTLR